MAESVEAVESPDQSSHSSVLRYAVVFLALLILAAVSYGLSRLDLGEWNLLAAMAIAFVKAALVVLFFMHLWDHGGASRLTLAIALCFIAILMGLTVADVGFRFPVANPPTSVQARRYMGDRPLPEDPEPSLAPDRQPALER